MELPAQRLCTVRLQCFFLFENLKNTENKNTDSDNIEPFEFSKEVLDGDRLITVVGIKK